MRGHPGADRARRGGLRRAPLRRGDLAGAPGEIDLLSWTLSRAALGAGLLAAACATAEAPPDRVPAGATPVEYARVPQASDPRWRTFDRPVARLVRSRGEWTDLWRSLTGGTVPIPAPPPVHFSSEIVAFLSVEPGREIEVVGAWRAGDRLFVETLETVPGPGCPVPTTDEGAVVAIRLDRWPGIEGRFLGRVETRECS